MRSEIYFVCDVTVRFRADGAAISEYHQHILSESK